MQPSHCRSEIRSLSKSHAIPNIDEATAAYWGSGKLHAERTQSRAMPSAIPIEISKGSARLLGQNGSLNASRITTVSPTARMRVTNVVGISPLSSAASCPRANVPANPTAAIREKRMVGPFGVLRQCLCQRAPPRSQHRILLPKRQPIAEK